MPTAFAAGLMGGFMVPCTWSVNATSTMLLRCTQQYITAEVSERRGFGEGNISLGQPERSNDMHKRSGPSPPGVTAGAQEYRGFTGLQ